MGGALLSDVPKDADPSSLNFVGSTLVIDAASREEVLEFLKKDIYTETGVWDIEKVQMWPVSPPPRHFLCVSPINLSVM